MFELQHLLTRLERYKNSIRNKDMHLDVWTDLQSCKSLDQSYIKHCCLDRFSDNAVLSLIDALEKWTVVYSIAANLGDPSPKNFVWLGKYLAKNETVILGNAGVDYLDESWYDDGPNIRVRVEHWMEKEIIKLMTE